MKRIDLAYMAGLFDGEGSIFIAKEIHPINRRKTPYRFVLQVTLTMANPYLPKMFQFIFGGSFIQAKEADKQRQATWRWVIKSRKAKDFLIVIKPYLRLKLNEAELAIAFQNAKVKGAVKGHKGVCQKTDEELALEEAQSLLLHNLKVKSKG